MMGDCVYKYKITVNRQCSSLCIWDLEYRVNAKTVYITEHNQQNVKANDNMGENIYK